MRITAIQKIASRYAKREFREDLLSTLYLGKDNGMKGYNIYEFKVFLKDNKEYYLNIIEIQKGNKKEFVYDLTPKE